VDRGFDAVSSGWKGAGVKNPIAVAFRTTFSGALTRDDADGEPISTIR
jgi:hypothetical protein